MKNKKMSLNPKKKCIYIKNKYISKNPKLNNSINNCFENKKLFSDYNVNKKGISNTIKQPFKKSVKAVYQNISSQKSKYLIKSNQKYLSTKNIHLKSPKKDEIQDPTLFETYIQSISGRRTGIKKYEVTNPFKERSNSENSINYFTRTYTFFRNSNNKNNKENNNNRNNNTKENKKNLVENNDNNININNNKISNSKSYITIGSKKNNELKINLNSINFYKNIYNVKNNNNIKQGKKIIDYSYQKKSTTSAGNTLKNNKKFIYKEQALKKSTNQKINQKDSLNTTEPISSQINIFLSPIISTASNDNNQDINTIKNSKRIQKYILSDKKRKMKSRQNIRENKYKDTKSKSICPEHKRHAHSPKKYNNNNDNSNNNIPVNKYVKNKSTDPRTKFININKTKKIFTKKNEEKIYNENSHQLDTRYYYEKDSTIDGITEINQNGFLFENSALIIQSVFRGYLVKSRLETYLYNYKFYNKAVDILENLFTSYLQKKIGIEPEKRFFLNYLIKIPKIKNIKSNKSCKMFKLYNIPTSPLTESENVSVQNKFVDLFLHKEIGERFNIITKNSNREKELEKKHKEELDDVNNKIIKLIKENNILKNINQKNKLNESKYHELSLENKKKENIINIITNDNQNLAKKLKVLKDKINKFEIQNQIMFNINSEISDKKYLYKYNNTKELIEAYRKIYLLFLFYKKDVNRNENIKKYFDIYKNIIIKEKYENKLNNINKEKYLNNIINNAENKKNKILYHFFTKLNYISLSNKKENEFRKKIIKEKLKNLVLKKDKMNKIILKSYFNSFYTKSIISKLIDEKNKDEENKKNKILKNLKKIIISLNKRNNIYNSIKYKNYFTRWILLSKILSMKAVTDEKKRKKRQKQRTKRKIEKNKSANKFILSSSMSQNMNLDKNCINKTKEKEKINYLEHTVTTDLSIAETNPEIKTDKILKGVEKLNDTFLKAMIFYKILGIKNGETNVSINKDNIYSSNNTKVTEKDKKESKISHVESDDEDSGESSFGL